MAVMPTTLVFVFILFAVTVINELLLAPVNKCINAALYYHTHNTAYNRVGYKRGKITGIDVAYKRESCSTYKPGYIISNGYGAVYMVVQIVLH